MPGSRRQQEEDSALECSFPTVQPMAYPPSWAEKEEVLTAHPCPRLGGLSDRWSGSPGTGLDLASGSSWGWDCLGEGGPEPWVHHDVIMMTGTGLG